MKRIALGILITLVLSAMLLIPSESYSAGQSLGSYNVDLRQTSVSGVSSGGYMAGQLHIAYSESMVGVGIIAAGPYYCSQGDGVVALQRCIGPGIPTIIGTDAPTVEPSLAEIEKMSTTCAVDDDAGNCLSFFIDDPANVSNDKVYIFTGLLDNVVGTPIVDVVNELYERLNETYAGGTIEIQYLRNEVAIPARHAMITDDCCNRCWDQKAPYINDCNYDMAGELLKHIYGDNLNDPVEPVGEIVEFDQSEFTGSELTSINMHETGFAYIPTGCAAGELCRVHIVIHGCEQSVVDMGDTFYIKTGYNEWGQANNIIMLYPQASNQPTLNPASCWDFGQAYYADPNFHTKEAGQVKTIMNMVKRLAGEEFEP